MNKNIERVLPCLVLAACAATSPLAAQHATSQSNLSPAARLLLADWTGPYGGVPPFDRIEVDGFKPAYEHAMAAYLAEIDRIVSDPAPATFANTIAAYERAGRAYRRVESIYGVWGSNMSTPAFQAVQREMAPKIAAFDDRIYQNEALFNRIRAVYEAPDKQKLTPEQQRVAWLHYRNFVRAGAQLDAAGKEKLSAINQRLASLYTQFSQNVLADEEKYKIEADGKVITNTRSSVDPFLTTSPRRDLRERAWRMFVSRGDNGDANDNKAIITEILKLRADRAQLLGYATHAHYRLDIAMAKTPERALELMEAVWKPAVARVHEEVRDMQQLADKEGAGITIEPWDYRYYAEKVRAARYDLDEAEVKEYLQLDKLREGMFWVAGELFDFAFKPVTSVPVFHPDVRVWEVTNRTTGKHVGVWYFDPFARPGKRSGAWATAYRRQEKFDQPITTLVSNNSNFVKGAPGEPVLISWDDAETLFHEFGHALHQLSSNVNYPSVAGTAVPRDYVEFPSQLMEPWLATPEVLQRFALHYKTGKPIPQSLVDRIKRAATFNEGFATTEYLSSALVDMKAHLEGARPIDPQTFERETLAQLGMPRELVMRHRMPQFSHIFSGDSYSAGYYSYLWSDVITADAFAAFTEAGGPYDREIARKLRDYVFSVGNTMDPAEAYRKFRGRDPKIEALLRKRGFPVP